MEIYDKTNNEIELENIILSYESFLKKNSEISLYKSRLYLRRKKISGSNWSIREDNYSRWSDTSRTTKSFHFR